MVNFMVTVTERTCLGPSKGHGHYLGQCREMPEPEHRIPGGYIKVLLSDSESPPESRSHMAEHVYHCSALSPHVLGVIYFKGIG